MSERKALDQYIETLQILAREGDTDRSDEERGRDAAHRAKLIDAFAHELAEQIRRQTARGNMIREEFADPWEMGLLRGADVIEPRPDDYGAGPELPAADEETST